MDAGALIKRARTAAGMSQRTLAKRARVSSYAISRYEHGSRVPSIATLTSVLAAAGCQLRVELEQLDADVREAIARVAAEPMADRVVVSRWVSFPELSRVAYRVEGMAAAIFLGAPLPADHYELAFADTAETLAVLATLTTTSAYAIEAVRRRGPKFRAVRASPDTSGEQLRAWLSTHCSDGTFWLRCAFSEAQARLATPDEVARYVDVTTPHGPVRVAPLHEIDGGADDHVRRVLRVLREATHGSGDDAARAPSPERSRGELGPLQVGPVRHA